MCLSFLIFGVNPSAHTRGVATFPLKGKELKFVCNLKLYPIFKFFLQTPHLKKGRVGTRKRARGGYF